MDYDYIFVYCKSDDTYDIVRDVGVLAAGGEEDVELLIKKEMERYRERLADRQTDITYNNSS